ncbi:MAG: HU family DNA-binding protein [Tannerellaceae bacterium]|jgi:nucleoid DNA-binding protein|nr:HU family DNA-binding protein [Tannerellaceae bacterium]
MNNRLTIKELAVELVKSSGKDQESVERFLNEFISVISENIFTDRFVQVKGIGTFKIIQVEKRESVDVNTKERIIIPEHYKLTFSPEKDLKEVVNKPFAFFESIEINDDSDFPSVETELEKEKSIDGDEDADADDDVDSLYTESDTVKETVFTPEPEPQPATFDLETTEEVITPPTEEEKVTFVERIDPEIINEPEKPVVEPVIAKPVLSEPAPEMNVFIEKTVEPAPAIEEEQEEFFKEEEVINHLNGNNMNEFGENRSNKGYGREREPEPRSNNNTLVTLLLVFVVILIAALGSVVFMTRDVLFGGGTPVATTTPTEVFTLPGDDMEDESMEDDWGIGDEEADVTENPETNPTPDSNVIANVQIKRGDRLNLIALDYYGNKLFWVYIYEHNKSKITNPNSIPVGLELEIPAKSVYNIDANDQASVRRASVLQSQILSKYPGNNRYNSYNDPYGNPYNQYNNSYNQYSDPYQQYNDPYQNQYQNQNQYQQTPNYY